MKIKCQNGNVYLEMMQVNTLIQVVQDILKWYFFTILVITEMIEQTYFNYQLLHALCGLEDTLEIESF